ncbi:TrkH family potassium uptake protein [Sporosalibacterium faouarense]|uniref:TrkH family potassium uptake protein n=1 Tax=Sporosalibacterium faouarense TaxID=516123 RepID=UPI00192BBCC1|nr:TrkH family potassium uptake protein [Sporosalibacterium faouarense]
MVEKYSAIFYVLGSLLFLLGLVLLSPIILVLFYNENVVSLQAFIFPSIFSIIIGLILYTISNKSNLKLSLTGSMILCTLAWIVVSMIGAIPFQIALNKPFIDSFFEAVSGFTTTGITVFQGLDSLPKSIIFWRCLMQWLGGLGIITFFLFITFRNEGNIWQLFNAESHKMTMSRPVPNIYKTIKILWSLYFAFTFIQCIILLLLDVSMFDSIIHSLTSISTGGFSGYDSSIKHFRDVGHPNYRLIEYCIIFFMFIGGINFLVHYKVFTGNIKEFISNTEVKYFRRIIIISVILILLGKGTSVISSLSAFEEMLRKALFQVISIITSTGFITEDIGNPFFPSVAKLLFLILMFMGGCVGSTSGGFKVVRVVVLNQLFRRELKKIYLPKHAVVPVTLDKSIIEDEEIFKISSLFFAWILIIIIGSIISTLFSDLNAFQAISGMISSVSNIGPFYFSVEKMVSLSPIIKITYIIGMLAGRLEIIPIFVLFSRKAWK